uniref:Uncharacterized protein n=1 Tax=Parascaris equorum TaxID=6256 RepID=A0A914RTS0_PAREQ
MPGHPFPPFPLPPPPFFMSEIPLDLLFPPEIVPPDTEMARPPPSWSSPSQRRYQNQWEQWRKRYDKQWREYERRWQQQVKQWQRRQQHQWQQQQRPRQPQPVQPTIAAVQRNTAPVTASTYYQHSECRPKNHVAASEQSGRIVGFRYSWYEEILRLSVQKYCCYQIAWKKYSYDDTENACINVVDASVERKREP